MNAAVRQQVRERDEAGPLENAAARIENQGSTWFSHEQWRGV